MNEPRTTPLRSVRGADRSPLTKARDQRAETLLFGRRAIVAACAVLLAFLALGARLAWLQVLHHEHFSSLSDNNRVKLQPLPPTRGLIHDRNGVLLADNLPSFRLEITREEVEDLEATLARLRRLVTITEQDLARYRRFAQRTPAYNGVPVRLRLTEYEVARVAVELHSLPGVEIRADLTRYYPRGALGAHMVGYVGRIDEDELRRIDTSQYAGSTHIGKIGVERAYEDLLHGRVGFQQVETNAEGRVVRILEQTPPIPGRNVYLTMDLRMQAVAEASLADSGHNGAVVVLDTTTGEVLALASIPTYDPNPFVNGIDVASYNALNTSPDRPLFNRALRGVYPPGSTIKPMLGLAGLETGSVDRDHSVFCPGFFTLPNHQHRFRDWRRGGHGRTDLEKGIVESCDVYFYDLAYTMGIERMHDYLTAFSLGTATGIDLVGERSGLLPSPAWKRATHNQPWYAGETVIAGIGQGYMLATPLQLAHATATLANRGRHYQPRVLHATQDPGSTERIAEASRPLPDVTVRDPRNWDLVIRSMINVVHGQRGTARRIGEGIPYRIAGKTGTAQVFSLGQDERYDAASLAKELHDHALFIAFAPAEAPRVAVAVVAEHGGGGSSVAAPIARQVLDAYMGHVPREPPS